MKEKISLTLLLMILCTYAFSTEWFSYNTENTAYPSNHYNVIAIDESGNKWIGTQYKGIYKYDGVNWEIINSQNSDIPSNLIKHLNFDSTGNLWVSTSEGGLAKRNTNGQWTIYNSANSSLPVNDINWVSFDEFNNKWIATKNGLVLLDNFDAWTIFNSTNTPMTSNEILTVACETYNGNYIKWIGTANGLVRYDNNSWQIFNTSNSALTGNSIINIQIDKFHNKWLSIYNAATNTGGGLIKIDSLNTWTIFTKVNTSIPSNTVYSIACDSLENLNPVWITTDNGIGKLTGTSWTVFNTENTQGGLSSNDVFSIALEGTTKWFGTDKMMMKLASNVWTSFSILNSGIPNNKINSIFCHTYNNKNIRWIGTSSGLSKFDGTNWNVYNMANSPLPSNDISTVAVDLNHVIWIGSNPFQSVGGGLTSLNLLNDEWEVFTTANSDLPTNAVSAIVVDQFNNKWIGTKGGGLLKLTTGLEFYFYNEANSQLSSNYINALFIDNDNTIWISTDYGVSNFNPANNSWQVYNTFNSPLTSNIIRKVKVLNESNEVWIVTANSLARKIGSTWTIFNTSNSALSTNNIQDIDFDNGSYKWITTANGLYKTDGVTWKLYSSPTYNLSSNNLSVLFIENINGKNYKWFGTQSAGLNLFTGDNPGLTPGLNLSVLQHNLLGNVVKLVASANLIIPDTIYITVNNTPMEYENLGNNIWFSQFTATENANYIFRFRVKNAYIDSTLSKTVAITEIDGNQKKAFSPDLRFSLSDESNTQYYVQIYQESEDTDEFVYHVSTLQNSENKKLYFNSNQYQYKVYYSEAGTSREINAIYTNGKTVIEYQGDGTYTFKKSEIVKPTWQVTAYPNPFNPSITIKVKTDNEKTDEQISVDIYNIKGQKINTLQPVLYSGNEIKFTWNGDSQKGFKVSSGIYFFRIKGSYVDHKGKIILLK